jgi:hypothetical protein
MTVEAILSAKRGGVVTDPFPCRSLRHAVYAALLHFGLESVNQMRESTK